MLSRISNGSVICSTSTWSYDTSWVTASTRPTKASIDNQSAPQHVTNPVHHEQSKHVDSKYHWIRDMVTFKAIELIHVVKTEQRADFLTKTLPGDVFWLHMVAIMHACSIGEWLKSTLHAPSPSLTCTYHKVCHIVMSILLIISML